VLDSLLLPTLSDPLFLLAILDFEIH
jgi:hypothetical protein